MIFLRYAKFQNFRSLRNVELHFSLNEEKPLTIIRAENGTGKTSLLTALTWGLFGDDGLPISRRNRIKYKIRPMDWDLESSGHRVPIRVEIGITLKDDQSGAPKDYEIIREQIEVINDGDLNSTTLETMNLTIFHKTEDGHKNVIEPELFLKANIIPPALKEIFFVDGDAAYRFMNADEGSDRRTKVEQAIRDLLGLGVLEAAQRHLENSKSDIIKKLRKENSGTTVGDLAEKESQSQTAITSFQELFAAASDDLTATRERKSRYEAQRDSIMASGGGDRAAMQRERATLSESIGHTKSTVERQRKILKDRLNSSDLLFSVAQNVLSKTASIFADLEKRKVIPNTLPEILEEVVEKGICICGADVTEGSAGHTHLSNSLQAMRGQTQTNSTLLQLSKGFSGHLRQVHSTTSSWSVVTKDVQRTLYDAQNTLERQQANLAGLDNKIKDIPETNLQLVLSSIATEQSEIERLTREIAVLEAKIDTEVANRNNYRRERDLVTAKNVKYKKILAQERAAEDLLKVVSQTIRHLQEETLDRVSSMMNEMFLKMIVRSPENADSRSAIEEARLTRNYDIRIFGSGGVEMTVDDLSGAQKRALTVAFLLTLIQVSGENAVNVIDTPLGMTSGALRKAFLKLTLENSKQSVLLLTRAEISGVEDILKQYAGVDYTMSHSSHFPGELTNKPPTEYDEVIVCGCGISENCKICKRIGD
jgi:DNA sulfur modification protein DndD